MRRKKFQRKEGKKGFQKSKRNKLFCGLAFLALFLLVAGCGGGTPPSSLPEKGRSPSIDKKKIEPAKVVEKKELEKKEEEVYTYNPSGKPDPFKPFIQLTVIKESSRKIPLTPLQKYELNQLKLVAIIATPDGNIAMVEDSTGKGYFLKKGTEIGKNDGKVTRILQNKVIIEELYQDIYGQTKSNEVSLFLHRLEEGGGS